MEAQIEVEMVTSRPKKGKDKGRTHFVTSVTITAPKEEELSYLPSPTTILGYSLYNINFIMNTGVPLSLMRTLRHRTMRKLTIMDTEAHAQGIEGESR